MSYKQAVEDILKQVEKPGRYVGGEWNEIKKNPAEAEAKIGLIFPDVYEIGMSYLGQKILYSVLNSHPSMLAERIFAPGPDLEEKLRFRKMPLFSLENKIPLCDFDILGFSLLYELNYSNILTILDLAGIPFLSKERDKGFPLIIAGGPAAFNPEPVSDIFDAFFLGDGEEAFPELVKKFVSLRKSGANKDEILNELAKAQGIYIPRLYESFMPLGSALLARRPKEGTPEKIKKRSLSSLGKTFFPEEIVVPDIRVVFDRVAIEVARGCPQRCRFCQATNIYFPFRIMNQASVKNKIYGSLRSTGYEDVSLSALSVSDYPNLGETVAALMEGLAKQKVSLSLSALRPQGLTSAIPDHILRVRKTGFTLVPEAGTDRLRRVINKNLRNQDILDAAAHAFGRGWQLLKLYFMIGLPTETQEDLEGIVRLAGEIIQTGKSIMRAPPRINLSLSSFIPKPHTPFQWLAMEEEESLGEKQRFIRSRLRRFPTIKIKDRPTKTSVLEGVFSRGDRRLGPALIQAWEKGARFDSWKDCFDFSFWEEAFAAENLDYRVYLGPLNTEATLPWDHIDTGIKKDFLLAELKKARQEESTPSCLDAACSQCQGCDAGLRPVKKSSEDLKLKTREFPSFGEHADRVLRYEVLYSKSGRARFLSHLDLSNHLRRAMRRAGIELSYSEGFHPKMLISYGPALPLGMEGKAEGFEFKSSYHFDERKFVRRLNRCLGSGIRFFRLRNLTESDLPLNARIRGMIYSVNLGNPDVSKALETRKQEKSRTVDNNQDFVHEEMAEFWRHNPESLTNFWVDKKKNQLFLALPYSFRRGLRSQDIVERVFGLPNPTFYLTRERFIFEGEKTSQIP